MPTRTISVPIPVEIFCQTDTGVAEEVLHGTYEAGFYGHHLRVLDIGANIGAFAIWANLRWPQSQIYCYEPHPGTFQTLLRNLGPLENVHCTQAAVYPRELPLYALHADDGEAALIDQAQRFFRSTADGERISVPVVSPAELPRADIVKLDTEGSEIEILRTLDLTETSLVLAEYHTLADRDEICRMLASFTLAHENRQPWGALSGSRYNPELANDFFGVLALFREGSKNVWRNQVPLPPWPGIRRALKGMSVTFKALLAARLRRREKTTTSNPQRHS